MITFQPVIPVLFIVLICLVGFAALVTLAWTNKERRGWWIFRMLYIVGIGLMLLRPSVPSYESVDVYTNQYDVYFVVDSTASMVAEDWAAESAQTRLDGVKQDIQNLAMAYTGAKFSLIKFDSTTVNVSTPLTKDVTTLMTSVRNLSPELTRQAQGSSPFLPADEVAKVIERNSEDQPERARIVFYFGDGEATASSPISQDFTTSSNLISGGAVYGYGTEEGGKMKYQNGYYITAENGYIQDSTTGTDGLSKIDETTLQTIASQLGVDYVHRTSDSMIEPIELAPSSLISSTTSMNTLVDYTWVIGLLLVGVASVDIAQILTQFRRATVKTKEVNV